MLYPLPGGTGTATATGSAPVTTGADLRRRRLAARLSRGDVAKLLGLGREQDVDAIELGRVRLEPERLRALDRALTAAAGGGVRALLRRPDP